MTDWRSLFARQADLARYYQQVRPDGFYAQDPMTRCTTWTQAIIHECCELDDELSWKPWKNGRELDQTREARLAEMADILHFFLHLALDQALPPRISTRHMCAKTQESRAAAD